MKIMKKILLAAIIMASALTANAQSEKKACDKCADQKECKMDKKACDKKGNCKEAKACCKEAKACDATTAATAQDCCKKEAKKGAKKAVKKVAKKAKK